MSLLNFQLMISNELLHASDMEPVNQRKRGRPLAALSSIDSDSSSPSSPAPSNISNVSSQGSSQSTKRSYTIYLNLQNPCASIKSVIGLNGEQREGVGYAIPGFQNPNAQNVRYIYVVTPKKTVLFHTIHKKLIKVIKK